MNTDPANFTKAKSWLEEAQSIIITNHVNPDGDAIGSALGLYLALKHHGFNVRVMVPNDYPSFLKWMEGTDEVMVYEKSRLVCDEILSKTDLIFHLDYNDLSRSGAMEDSLRASSARKVMIDHHRQPADFADITFSDSKMSSTSEMVYHFLEKTDLIGNLTMGAGEGLYTGLITDTGNFRFSATTPETHRVAAELLKLGVKSNVVASRVYDSNSPSRLKLLSRALDRMEVIQKYSASIIYLTEQDLEDLHYEKGDTEGIVNYGLSLEGIEVSAFMYPKDGQVKISFRSKTDFDVNQLARNYFNGGGHLNAAGGVSDQPLEQTITKLKDVLKELTNDLHKN